MPTRPLIDRLARALALPVLALSLAAAGPAKTPDVCTEEAMLVFDASGSMALVDPTLQVSKIDLARQAAAEVLPDITAERPTGLVTYGGIPGASCNSVSLRFPPMRKSAELILAELLTLEPAGQTALSQATWLAAQTIDRNARPATIVVVTDGAENCGLNACLLGAKLAAEAPHIKVHVIGFRINSVVERSVSCLATATGGTYTSVRDVESLRRALKVTLACPKIS